MESLWGKTANIPQFDPLIGNRETEVLVIGGGMAGVLCARRLHQAGKNVTLVEAERVGGGITAGTTAVLTAQHDMLYQDMTERFGDDTARAYLHANLEAVSEFRSLAKDIPCDFADVPSVQFTTKSPERLRAEAKTVRALGFAAEFQTSAPLIKDAVGAVVFPGMAQFHPLKFLAGAVKGLQIYEHSRVIGLDGTTARLARGSIHANKIVVATHFPFINRRGLYFMKLYQSRSYVVALANAPDPDATMAELEGDGIYFRRAGDLLLVGGGDHRTGKQGGGFRFLREYCQTRFPQAEERLAWANQDCMSLDGLPYIGEYSPHMPNVYVATGFNAWGMTNSMVAARMLTEQICGREHPLADALSPSRSVLHKQLFSNLKETLADFVRPTTKRCPHLGCALRWNPQEHSWDCPCHGSRFAVDGTLLDTPAQKDAQL